MPDTPAPSPQPPASRTAEVHRATAETTIDLVLNLDGAGLGELDTGLGFLDHMLTHIARHGLVDLTVRCQGDLHVDAHHTVEDVGIALGMAIRQAVGDKRGIVRYGHFTLPMDDALVLCALDLSGRPYLDFALDLPPIMIGQMPTELVEEFFRAVVNNAGMNLHFRHLAGTNSHHLVEAAFKAFAKSLRMAVEKDPRTDEIPSTKGLL
ncbi:MAG: imidazoleglycerol-phosphate dehydratase HisB [Armatimonadetes bacterium]|nr:imidazoleglycerol-phosphate dehydratase HisB [Armatimonadota bacterium]